MNTINKELQTIRNEMKATFKYIAHCEERTCDGDYQCHHIYDDQGNPQSLEELYDYVEKTIRRLLEEQELTLTAKFAKDMKDIAGHIKNIDTDTLKVTK